jgi:hypothetical protein
MWEHQPLTTVWAFTACYRDSFSLVKVTNIFVATCCQLARDEGITVYLKQWDAYQAAHWQQMLTTVDVLGANLKCIRHRRLQDANWNFNLTAVWTGNTRRVESFWVATPCSPLKDHEIFGGTSLLHLQGLISQTSNQRELGMKESSCCRFSLSLFLDPENGGYTVLRNVGWLSTDYTALCCRRYKSL